MFYTIYKTTNLINGKIYIGCHKTSNLEDDYLGSGKLLKYSIRKYGVENFKREWIAVFDNSEEMFSMEANLVNEDFIDRDDTHNLKLGGDGGFDYIHSHQNAPEWRKKARDCAYQILKEKFGDDWIHKIGILAVNGITPESIEKRKSTMKLRYGDDAYKNFSGKSHTEETKRRISDANKLNVGDKNSQFGKMWITDGSENKKIKKGDPIPEGWNPGRRIKK